MSDLKPNEVTSSTTPPPPKVTALQLWNNLLAVTLEDHLVCRVTKNRMLPLTKHLEKAKAAIEAAEQFEVTKHRTIVDALIERVKIADERKEQVKKLIKATWLWQFKKRKAYKREYIVYSTSREVYQQALLVVVNSIPPQPVKQPIEKEASMNGKEHIIVSGK